MATTTNRRVARTPAQTVKRNWLQEVSRQVKKRPSAAILYGVPGVGKSSFAAQFPGVVFLIDSNEDGVNRLKEYGLVNPDIPVFPSVGSWPETMEVLNSLREEEHEFKTLAVDALGGFERLCHEEVCRRDFNGEWGQQGFGSYQAGYDVSLNDWRQFLAALDKLRDEKEMSIMLIGHAKISPFKNPSGPDYDRYTVDIHHKTWSLTHKWADMVLFANYDTAFLSSDANKQKAKAKGGTARVLYTEREAAFDAKNRHGLPSEIDLGNSAEEAYSNFCSAISNREK